MAPIRANRVGEQIKKELSQILQQEMKDPRIGFVTITAVEMTGDLQIAKVLISIFGTNEAKEETLQALERAKGFIRSEMGRRIHLKHTPEFEFILDHSLEQSDHISRLLKEVKHKRSEE